jgi:hypothetical protein
VYYGVAYKRAITIKQKLSCHPGRKCIKRRECEYLIAVHPLMVNRDPFLCKLRDIYRQRQQNAFQRRIEGYSLLTLPMLCPFHRDFRLQFNTQQCFERNQGAESGIGNSWFDIANE